MLMQMLMTVQMQATYVRTTVSIREDLYHRLRRDPRGVKAALNEALEQRFQRRKGRHPLYGLVPEISRRDFRELRDHEDHGPA